MTEPVTGRCLCGSVAYECVGPVGPAHYCHCEDCRRHTGSAFNVGVRVSAAAFRITRGRPSSFTKRADSGNELTRHFCLGCGSPIYTSSPVHPEHVYVKAGTLDDPTVVRPELQVWSASAVPWCRIADGLPAHDKGVSRRGK